MNEPELLPSDLDLREALDPGETARLLEPMAERLAQHPYRPLAAHPRKDGSYHLRYAARGGEVHALLRPVDPGGLVPLPGGALFGVPFPQDPGFPGLAEAASDLPRLACRALAAEGGMPPPGLHPDARVLGYRPGRRCTFELRDGHEPAPAAPRALYAKLLRPGAARRVRASLRAMEGSGIFPDLLPEVPGPPLLFFRAAEGTSLHDLLRRDGFGSSGGVPAALEAAAAVLAHLRRSPLPEARHAREDELRLVCDRGSLLESLFPTLAAWSRDAIGRLEAWSRALPAGTTGPVHRDLFDRQVIVSAQGARLLDPDTLARGEPALDSGNLAAHLLLRAAELGRPAAEARAAARRWLELSGGEERALLYTGTTLFRLVLLYALRPPERQIVPALVATLDDLLREHALG